MILDNLKQEENKPQRYDFFHEEYNEICEENLQMPLKIGAKEAHNIKETTDISII